MPSIVYKLCKTDEKEYSFVQNSEKFSPGQQRVYLREGNPPRLTKILILHWKKGYQFSRLQPGPDSPWPGIMKLFPARESLVSDGGRENG